MFRCSLPFGSLCRNFFVSHVHVNPEARAPDYDRDRNLPSTDLRSK
jgi:hypothetical protein